MKKTDDFLINRIKWKADSYHLPTKSSFYFKDLNSDLQLDLKAFVDQTNSGPPILFFTKPTKEWTLICTRQVIFNDNLTTTHIDISDIDSMIATGWGTENHDKNKLHQLTVTDKKSNQYILHADKGTDLFALWNILLMMKRILTD
ncbi:MAG: hypothetical protein J7604_14265 [Sporocytophaga sp.]|uniref:hypothetical protein n=1 Tax=Sporocytophaga sp. TaxID=2231183 RepID=UPI001B238379|nr:hypothetical protein [Sporocytophaga sp.]MBO9701370.1 hypothetical protein [Sporocytophaga sp.]